MKILLITSIYPIPDVKITGGTSVCHYFAKEWVEQGHEVKVINTYTVYPRIFHWISNFFEKTISNKFPVSINKKRFSNSFTYDIDGVEVLLSPTFKKMPKAGFGSKAIDTTVARIETFLSDRGFEPDIITTHFLHPNLEIVPKLKKTFPHIPCGISLHGKTYTEHNVNLIRAHKDMIDFWGFRSFPIARSFKENCFTPDKEIYCFSGVPECYIVSDSYKKHEKKGVDSFLFVGNLIWRKHPLTVLESLCDTQRSFSLSYIGSGKQQAQIENFVKNNELTSTVSLEGRLPREKVAKRMLESECFIMVSEDETFGLVYLEAMANGCIVIASVDEGMDGIIKDGVNGFLCKAGDKDSLSKTISKIQNLSPSDKMKISRNAIATAYKMTDKAVANDYLNRLKNIVEL